MRAAARHRPGLLAALVGVSGAALCLATVVVSAVSSRRTSQRTSAFACADANYLRNSFRILSPIAL